MTSFGSFVMTVDPIKIEIDIGIDDDDDDKDEVPIDWPVDNAFVGAIVVVPDSC